MVRVRERERVVCVRVCVCVSEGEKRKEWLDLRIGGMKKVMQNDISPQIWRVKMSFCSGKGGKKYVGNAIFCSSL